LGQIGRAGGRVKCGKAAQFMASAAGRPWRSTGALVAPSGGVEDAGAMDTLVDFAPIDTQHVDVLIVATSLNAELNPRRLERYASMGHEAGAQVVVALTKSDLADDAEAEVGNLATLLRLPVVAVSSHTGFGLDGLGLRRLCFNLSHRLRRKQQQLRRVHLLRTAAVQLPQKMLHPVKQPRLLHLLQADGGGLLILEREKLVNECVTLREVVGKLRDGGVLAHRGPRRLGHCV